MPNNFSGYQKKVIQNYYDNIDKIALAKLQDLVTDIFLADSEAKKAKLWEKVAVAMGKLKIPTAIAANILKHKDPKILAQNITGWLK